MESGGSICWQSIGCTDGSDKNTSKQEGCLQHDAEQDIRPRIPEYPDQGGHPCLIPFQSIEVRSDVASNTGSEVDGFYWTVLVPDIVNSGREEQGSDSV